MHLAVAAYGSTATGQFLGVAVPAFQGLWAQPSQSGRGSLALGRCIFLHSSPRPLSPPRSPQRETFKYPSAQELKILVWLKQEEGKLERCSLKLLTRTCEFYYNSDSDSLGREWGLEVRFSN